MDIISILAFISAKCQFSYNVLIDFLPTLDGKILEGKDPAHLFIVVSPAHRTEPRTEQVLSRY